MTVSNPVPSLGSTVLPDRGAIQVAGPDRLTFLQGLLSNDVTAVTPTQSRYAALLTPQGKFLHDMFLWQADADSLLVETHRDRVTDLLRRLKLYRLRAKVTLEDASDRVETVVVFGDGAAQAFGLPEMAGATANQGDRRAQTDARVPALGVRVLAPPGSAPALSAEIGAIPREPADYNRLRLVLGVPDGDRGDLVAEKSTLLEANLDLLNAISWDKGCYVGQELTARMRYRGLVKKRLFPVTAAAALPPPGTPVHLEDREIGEVRSSAGGHGLALLRLDGLAAARAGHGCMSADGVSLTALRPSWMPDSAAGLGASDA